MTKYRISAVSRDWKENYDAKVLINAAKMVGGECEFTDVLDTRSDCFLMICSRPGLTQEQAQELFDIGDLCILEKDIFKGTLDEIKSELFDLVEKLNG